MPEQEIRRYEPLFRHKLNPENLADIMSEMIKSEIGASVRARD